MTSEPGPPHAFAVRDCLQVLLKIKKHSPEIDLIAHLLQNSTHHQLNQHNSQHHQRLDSHLVLSTSMSPVFKHKECAMPIHTPTCGFVGVVALHEACCTTNNNR